MGNQQETKMYNQYMSRFLRDYTRCTRSVLIYSAVGEWARRVDDIVRRLAKAR
jgi:hypothetical protein